MKLDGDVEVFGWDLMGNSIPSIEYKTNSQQALNQVFITKCLIELGIWLI